MHAHFKLILGESGIKSYHIPFEKEIFSKSFKPHEFNIKCISYVDELLLLLIRIVSKISLFTFSNKWGNKLTVTQDIKEFKWLLEKVSINDLVKNCNEKLNVDCTDIFSKIYNEGLTKPYLLTFKRKVKPLLKKYRRFSRINLLYIKIKSKILSTLYKINRKIRIVDVPTHRTFIDKGIIIAILGSDGTGKTTIVPMIKDVFSKKLDVITLYMGSGKGRSSIIRSALRLFKNNKKNNKLINNNGNYNKSLNLRLLGRIIWGLILAKEKINKLSRIKKIADRGMMVICDRYPQSQIEGYNDGPLLTSVYNNGSALTKKICLFEQKLFKKAEEVYPDIVIKLIADPKVLKERRPEMDIDQINKKQKGISNLTFNKKTKVFEVNSEKSAKKTLIKCMNSIDKCISTKNNLIKSKFFE